MPDDVNDLRPALAGKGHDRLDIDDVPYYQLWASPFEPGLSILDLLMNEGPAGLLTLRRMARMDNSLQQQ